MWLQFNPNKYIAERLIIINGRVQFAFCKQTQSDKNRFRGHDARIFAFFRPSEQTLLLFLCEFNQNANRQVI